MLGSKRVGIFARNILLLCGLLATGCITEDLSDCVTTYVLHAKVQATVDDDVADVKDVVLYIFDHNGLFVEAIDTTVGSGVPVRLSKGKSATVIAWGNLSGENQTRPAPDVGDPLAMCSINLITASRVGESCRSPDDLFYGALTLTQNDMAGNKDIFIYRRTGKMAIIIKGWESYFPDAESTDLSVVVDGSYGSLNFSGVAHGEKISFSPRGEVNGANEYDIKPFGMFQCDSLSISVAAQGYPSITVDRDDQGRHIGIIAGGISNVLLDLRFSVRVSVVLTGWRTETVWKDF